MSPRAVCAICQPVALMNGVGVGDDDAVGLGVGVMVTVGVGVGSRGVACACPVAVIGGAASGADGSNAGASVRASAPERRSTTSARGPAVGCSPRNPTKANGSLGESVSET